MGHVSRATASEPPAGRSRRFNPRLHPVLALGIGLGLAALLLPGQTPEAELHSDEEILEALSGGAIDREHGPLFWLIEHRSDTPLYAEALRRCSRPEARLRPNCSLLHRLEALRQPLAEPDPVLALELPAEPPPAEED